MNLTDKLTIILEAQQWQVVFEVLGDGRFRMVAPLIQEMQKQLQSQELAMTTPEQKGNGADKEIPTLA